jgi:hypothetical protein
VFVNLKVFPLLFRIGNGNLTILVFSSKGEGIAAIQSWGGLPVEGMGQFGCNNILHKAGSVTKQSIGIKYAIDI